MTENLSLIQAVADSVSAYRDFPLIGSRAASGSPPRSI